MDEHELVSKYDFQRLIKQLEKWLEIKRWGFNLVYSNPAPQSPNYYIVYQSEQCKIRIRWEQDRPYESPKIYLSYGRSHALPDQSFMTWNGEKCLCWHEVERVINYLDGLSPVEASSISSIPKVVNDFRKKSIGKGFEEPEYIARKNVYIWERYGQRIFNVFDIRQTDLWDEYVEFINECGRISEQKARSQGYGWDSRLYKVC